MKNNNPFDLTLNVIDFESIFKKEFSIILQNSIRELNLKYRKLDNCERDAHILKILNYLDGNIMPSGPGRQKDWDKGWGQNLEEFEKSGLNLNALLPYYYRRGKSVMRFNGNYIFPEDDYFEAKFLNIIQQILCESYFNTYENIYEFGCGPCHNAISFGQKLKNRNFYLTDWVLPSINIAKKIELNKENLGLTTNTFRSQLFDFFDPDLSFKILPNSVVLTFGSLEQIGSNYAQFLKYLLNQEANLYIHIEPILELYDVKKLIDYMGFKYSIKRGYLEGYYTALQGLADRREISILESTKILGSSFHDGWSMICWKKI